MPHFHFVSRSVKNAAIWGIFSDVQPPARRFSAILCPRRRTENEPECDVIFEDKLFIARNHRDKIRAPLAFTIG